MPVGVKIALIFICIALLFGFYLVRKANKAILIDIGVVVYVGLSGWAFVKLLPVIRPVLGELESVPPFVQPVLLVAVVSLLFLAWIIGSAFVASEIIWREKR